MKNHSKLFSCLLTIFLFLSCNINDSPIKKAELKDSVTIQAQSSAIESEVNCSNLISEIIRSSNGFDSVVNATQSFLSRDKINLTIDEATQTFVSMELSFTNEEGRDATLAWFMLDLKSGQLTDITIDPDKPIGLKFNQNLLRAYKKHCKGFIQ
jgi:hypothetical protein